MMLIVAFYVRNNKLVCAVKFIFVDRRSKTNTIAAIGQPRSPYNRPI